MVVCDAPMCHLKYIGCLAKAGGRYVSLRSPDVITGMILEVWLEPGEDMDVCDAPIQPDHHPTLAKRPKSSQ